MGLLRITSCCRQPRTCFWVTAIRSVCQFCLHCRFLQNITYYYIILWYYNIRSSYIYWAILVCCIASKVTILQWGARWQQLTTMRPVELQTRQEAVLPFTSGLLCTGWMLCVFLFCFVFLSVRSSTYQLCCCEFLCCFVQELSTPQQHVETFCFV